MSWTFLFKHFRRQRGTVETFKRFVPSVDKPCLRTQSTFSRIRAHKPDTRDLGEEPGLEVVHRHGLPQLLRAPHHNAQHLREPRLDDPVHPLPTRGGPGETGGAAELPDDGVRVDRAGSCERVAAGRGHGRGRSPGVVLPPQQEEDHARVRQDAPPDDFRGGDQAGLAGVGRKGKHLREPCLRTLTKEFLSEKTLQQTLGLEFQTPQQQQNNFSPVQSRFQDFKDCFERNYVMTRTELPSWKFRICLLLTVLSSLS